MTKKATVSKKWRADAMIAVGLERDRQDAKWGQQDHEPIVWAAILGEEVGELNQAILETYFDNGPEQRAKGGYENMRNEAAHVSAVAQAFIEYLDRMESLKNVVVFRLNESDAVAAKSLDDAKAFYLQETGMDPEEAFDSYYMGDTVGIDSEIREEEGSTETVLLRDILLKSWQGKPFIAVSFE